ncbi:MAG TPA: hypothetical protein VES67_06085 [Vicinamibacterales bacterium]|nr:hypothetical protein [Vicinamibacterales bacterium]
MCESLCESKPDSASATPPPSGELPPAEPELFERAREAVGALRGRGRQANGQAGRQNTLALRHGLTSKQLVQQPDVAAWHQEQIAAIETDLGGPAELSSLARASVREVARLEVILGAMGDELLAHGVLTGKGKTRAATTTYLQVLDRFAKLANTLGLARQQKSLPSPAEYWAQKQQNGAAG